MNVRVKPLFYIGARLKFIGTDERRAPKEEYRIAWEECSPPDRADSGARFQLPVRVRNDSGSTWGMSGARQVQLVYRWLDETGTRLDVPRANSRLHSDVRPGEAISKIMRVETPEAPGRYVLVLDAVRKNVAVFSRRGGATCEGVVEVGPPAGRDDSSEAPDA